MRAFTIAAVLAGSVLSPNVARADEPSELELEVGERRKVGGFRPLCDDPAVAGFSGTEVGVIEGRKVGETRCSVSVGSPLGTRVVYRVLVIPAGAPEKGGKGKAKGG
jgi:hypothetical protein